MTHHASTSNSSPGHSSLGDFIHSAPDMPWLDDAACGALPLEQLNVFFVEAGRTIAASTIAMCRRCPVRQQCLDHAYSNDIASGYFGGVSPGQRRLLSHAAASAAIAAD
jgi:WhiB family transcriptional regulator, redox-sensing transcriptional regulator